MVTSSKRRSSPLAFVSVALDQLSTGLLVAILALITFDVITRNFGSTGILGTVEIVMLLLIIAVAGAFPQLERTNEFLRVDILQERLPAKIGTALRAFLTLIQLTFSAILTWRVAEYAAQQMQTGRTTDILKLPIAGPYWIAAFCFGILTLATFIQIIRIFKNLVSRQIEEATADTLSEPDVTKGMLS